MSLAQAHATCVALLLVDFLARTWRMQWLLRGLGHRLPFWEIFVHSALGEAASSLSPFRLGGEPSRIWAMTRLGVPLTPAVVAIGVEIVAMTPVVLAGAAMIVLYLAPEWWVAAGPALSRHARSGGPWVVGAVVLTAVAWRLARRAAPALRREIEAARAHVRELPAWQRVRLGTAIVDPRKPLTEVPITHAPGQHLGYVGTGVGHAVKDRKEFGPELADRREVAVALLRRPGRQARTALFELGETAVADEVLLDSLRWTRRVASRARLSCGSREGCAGARADDTPRATQCESSRWASPRGEAPTARPARCDAGSPVSFSVR